MSDRIQCIIIGCKRTHAAGFDEWICSKHWSSVSKDLKREYTREKRMVRHIILKNPGYNEYWKFPAGSKSRIEAYDIWRRLDAVWKRCKTQAIERAIGLQ